MLRKLEFYQRLSLVERRRLADELEEEVYEEGDVVVYEGEAAHAMYIVKHGHARVTKRPPPALAPSDAPADALEMFGPPPSAPPSPASAAVGSEAPAAVAAGRKAAASEPPSSETAQAHRAEVLAINKLMAERDKKAFAAYANSRADTSPARTEMKPSPTATSNTVAAPAAVRNQVCARRTPANAALAPADGAIIAAVARGGR